MSWPTITPATCAHASATSTRCAWRPDHGDELDLPVDAIGRDCDRRWRSGDARRELRERQRRRRQLEPGLVRVHRIVESEREHLSRPRHRRSEASVIDGLVGARARARSPSWLTHPTPRRRACGSLGKRPSLARCTSSAPIAHGVSRPSRFATSTLRKSTQISRVYATDAFGYRRRPPAHYLRESHMKLVTFDDGKVGRIEGDQVIELDVPDMRATTSAAAGVRDRRHLRARRRATAGADHPEEVLPHRRQLPGAPRGVKERQLVAPGAAVDRVLQNIDAIIGPEDNIVYPAHDLARWTTSSSSPS